MNKKAKQILVNIPILLFLLITPLSSLAIDQVDTSTEFIPGGETVKISGAPPVTPPPPPAIPTPKTGESILEETTTPPSAVDKEVIPAPQADLQKINQKINYLIGAAAIEFLLILILAIKICLYKRPKKEI